MDVSEAGRFCGRVDGAWLWYGNGLCSACGRPLHTWHPSPMPSGEQGGEGLKAES